jgi:hypothetical protein
MNDHNNIVTADNPNPSLVVNNMDPPNNHLLHPEKRHSIDTESDATRSIATGTATTFADEKAMNHRTRDATGDIREPTILEENEFGHDAFSAGADGNKDHIDFRTMGWVQAGFVCLAEVGGGIEALALGDVW